MELGVTIAKCPWCSARYLQGCISVRETSDRHTEQTPRKGLTGATEEIHMICPGSFNPETIARLRRLVEATYGGRDDLYAAAKQLNDDDLSAICRKLADELAGNTTFLQQIILIHGAEIGSEKAAVSALGDEIMKFLRKGRGDQGIIAAVQQEQSELREKYDAAIADTAEAEMKAILQQQQKSVDFAERVLRQVSPRLRDGS
jgi:uncharacterized protein (TIGR02284 family)